MLGHCFIVVGNVKWCGHYGKYYTSFSKIQLELPYDLAIPPEYIPKRTESAGLHR
jgi:hypothetical protein